MSPACRGHSGVHQNVLNSCQNVSSFSKACEIKSSYLQRDLKLPNFLCCGRGAGAEIGFSGRAGWRRLHRTHSRPPVTANTAAVDLVHLLTEEPGAM